MADPDLITRLRERALAAREEGTATALGDALHFEEAASEIEHLAGLRGDAHQIIDRIWGIFGRPSYAELAGRSIYSLVADAKADAERYRYLKDACSSHYPMTHDQPAEWSIGWSFQQGRPDEAYGSFDTWIDRDIAECAERQAKADAEEEIVF